MKILGSINNLNWGKELKWVPGDTEELFTAKESSESKTIYEKNPITYKLNLLGWRTNDNFSQEEPANLFLGCSHTFGQGLYYEDVWAYKVNQHIGGKYYNVGWPGSSLITEYRKLKIALNTYTIQNVFLFLPHYTRYEIHNTTTEGPQIFNPAWDYSEMSDEWRAHLGDSLNYNLMAELVVNAMIYLCNENDVPLYTMSQELSDFLQTKKKFSIPDCPCGGEWDYSNGPHDPRDNHHPVCVHNLIAEKYIESYDNKIQPSFVSMDKYV